METTYLVCAAVGGTLIVCQFVMTIIGIGSHFDLGDHGAGDAGHGLDGHDGPEVGHGNESTWFLGLLTARTLSAGLAFFGLVGLIAQRSNLDEAIALVVALLAGASSLFIVSWIMQSLVRLNIDGTVRIEHSLGCKGTVYVPIPAGNSGQGKVQVSVLNRTVEYKAVTENNGLATGRKIKVVGIVSSDTVQVSSIEDEN